MSYKVAPRSTNKLEKDQITSWRHDRMLFHRPFLPESPLKSNADMRNPGGNKDILSQGTIDHKTAIEPTTANLEISHNIQKGPTHTPGLILATIKSFPLMFIVRDNYQCQVDVVGDSDGH